MSGIEAEAREFLALATLKRAFENSVFTSGHAVTQETAIAAISELLTRVRRSDNQLDLANRVIEDRGFDCERLRQSLSASQTLLDECREVLGVLISTEKDHGPDESDINRAASLIEKLEGMG